MKRLHEQRLKWRLHGKNSPTWGFSYVNDELVVDVKVPQVMHYMLCYDRLVNHVILEQITKLRKGLVSYFKSNGIITLKKHVDVDNGIIVKKNI
jgi:hypothetical protein